MEFSIYFEIFFCKKRDASTSLGTEPRTFQLPVIRQHSTGNRKILGSIPSGVEAFLFSQNFFSKYNNLFFLGYLLIIRLRKKCYWTYSISAKSMYIIDSNQYAMELVPYVLVPIYYISMIHSIHDSVRNAIDSIAFFSQCIFSINFNQLFLLCNFNQWLNYGCTIICFKSY